jgi:hypothetical protein
MSSFKHQKLDESPPPVRNKTYALWFYQQQRDRRYFRLTTLGLALIAIPTILAILAIIILFLYNTSRPIPETDVTIKPPPAPTEPPTKSIIKPAAPPPTPPQIYNRPMVNSNGSTINRQPNRNSNGR